MHFFKLDVTSAYVSVLLASCHPYFGEGQALPSLLPTTPAVNPHELGHMEGARQVKIVISEIKGQQRDLSLV